MLIADLANAGSLPVVSEMMRFTARRQELIAHNIANLETPDFRQVDALPDSFQRALAAAVGQRRRTGNASGPLRPFETREIDRSASGELVLRPKSTSGGILFHDRNNRDLEGLMQHLAENGMAFRAAADLYRRENDLIRTAISQRV